MSVSFEQLAEVVADLERVKIRLSKLEKAQTILVVSADDVADLAAKSQRSKTDCLLALRETGGDSAGALKYLRTMAKSEDPV